MAQLPRFVLDRLDDLRPGILPTLEQFVDFLFAVEIQPDDHRSVRSVDGAEQRVRQEHSAIPLRDASNPAIIISPVKTEPERIHVVLRGSVNVAHRNLGNGLWKVFQHWTSRVWRNARRPFTRAADQNIAIGLTGEPVPRGIGSGAIINMNSHRLRLAAA